jgi:F-type H+-transporting ATPase subunit gamma
MSKGNLLIAKNRISTAGNILNISKAMELISTSKFRQLKTRRSSYLDLKESLMGCMAIVNSFINPYGKELTIVIGSDESLCGEYNYAIAKEVSKKEKNLFVIGNKLQSHFKNKDFQYKEFSLPHLIKEVLREKIAVIRVIYSRYENASIKVCNEVMFPVLDKQILENLKDKNNKVNKLENDYIIYEIDLKKAVQIYLDFIVNFYIMLGKISENYFRMTTMRNASINASELIEDLTRYYNKERQQLITKDIIEIIGGLNESR